MTNQAASVYLVMVANRQSVSPIDSLSCQQQGVWRWHGIPLTVQILNKGLTQTGVWLTTTDNIPCQLTCDTSQYSPTVRHKLQ